MDSPVGNSEWARRPLRLLALDGGGVRAVSQLTMIWMLMHRIQLEKKLDYPPLPCEYFDLIGGSSSGGVVAILLGRLRVSIDKCLEIYTKRSKEVFGQPQWGWGVWQSKFDHNILESIIFEELPAACGSTNIPGPTTDLPEASINPRSMMMRDINVDNSCGVFVTATPGRDAQKGYPTLFRTYQDPYSTRTSNIKIWEALRATCAAPTFFDPIDIDGCTYVDGGFGCNNPVSLVYEEARERWPNRNIECILSFGSGMGRTLSLPNPTHLESRFPKHWIQALERNATECESAHQDMLGRRELNGKYFRFNVEQGLESVSLIDWEKLGEIVLKTEAYLYEAHVERRMVELVAKLVALDDWRVEGHERETPAIPVTGYLTGHQQLTNNRNLPLLDEDPPPSYQR